LVAPKNDRASDSKQWSVRLGRDGSTTASLGLPCTEHRRSRIGKRRRSREDDAMREGNEYIDRYVSQKSSFYPYRADFCYDDQSDWLLYSMNKGMNVIFLLK
jgi:hypothetical protein